MTVRMLQRRGTATQWNSVGGSVVLQPGEVGVNTTDSSFKIGDGESVWNDLEYHYPDDVNELKYLQLAGGNTVTGTQVINGNVDLNGLLSVSIDLDVAGDVAIGGNLAVTGSITSGQINVNNNKIVGLSGPINDTDAATKGYVDEAIAGLQWKAPAHLLAKTNIALSSNSTDVLVIDGHTLDASDTQYGYRVLVTGQTTETENGIYLYSGVAGASYTLSRSSDANDYGDLENASIYVTEGTIYGGSSWVQSNHYLSSFAGQDWVQFNGTQQITDGAGLLKDGNTLSVIGTANRISVTPDNVDIDANYAGQTSINTLGTVQTGTWEGTEVAIAHGGTGATTAEDARSNLGLTAVATSSFGTTSGTVAEGNHNHNDIYYTQTVTDEIFGGYVSKGSSSTILGTLTANNYNVPISVETSNSITLSFNGGTGMHTRTATGNINIAASGYVSGATKTLFITCDSTSRTLTFPSSWIWVGSKPTGIAASKTGVLTVTSLGTAEANAVASWVAQV